MKKVPVIALTIVIFMLGYAFAELPGTLKWSFNTEEMTRSRPVIGDDGTIYVGSYSNKLYAVNPNGTLYWSFETGGAISTSAPVIADDGTIYIWSRDGNLYALNPNGTQKWSFSTSGDSDTTPALAMDGTIYFSAGQGFGDKHVLYALNPDGSEKWSKESSDYWREPVVGVDGTIYVVQCRNKFYAFNPDGTEKWMAVKDGDCGHAMPPAIAGDGTVYMSSGRNVYAFTPNGKEKFSLPGWSVCLGPDGTIYTGDHSRELRATYPDGSFKWTFSNPITYAKIYGTPAIGSDGTIYVNFFEGTEGNLYAMDPSGTVKWSISTGGDSANSSSPVIAPDGTLYIGTDGGHLLAIHTESKGLAYGNWPMVNGNAKHTGRSAGIAEDIPPELILSASPTSGEAPLAVEFTFDATDEDGTVVDYEWDYGDGKKATGNSAAYHIYENPGTYRATLTVKDNRGAITSTYSYIDAFSPLASFLEYQIDKTGDTGLIKVHIRVGGASRTGIISEAFLAVDQQIKIRIDPHNETCRLEIGKLSESFSEWTYSDSLLVETITTSGGIGQPDIKEYVYVPMTVNLTDIILLTSLPEYYQFPVYRSGETRSWSGGSSVIQGELRFTGNAIIGGQIVPFQKDITADQIRATVIFDDSAFPQLKIQPRFSLATNVFEYYPRSGLFMEGTVVGYGDRGTIKEYDYSVNLYQLSNNSSFSSTVHPVSFTLAYTAGPNGSITGEAIQVVYSGSDGTAVRAVPDTDYRFVQWSDGSTDNPRIDTNVAEDFNITAIFHMPGDVNADNRINLADAMLALQIVSGVIPSEVVHIAADVDGDGKIGLAEAIFVLQVISQLRDLDGPRPGADSFTNFLGMTFKLIPAGVFIMGSPEDEPERSSDETQHQVTLTKPFYMQATEVTQRQWKAVMGSNPSHFSSCGDDCPVEDVSWNDIQGFIAEINKHGKGIYGLPTEAEWEYASRAGSTTGFANGDVTVLGCGYDPNLDAMGWYCGNSDVSYAGCYDTSGWGGPVCSGTHPVARKQPNAWGLYDMHGNVLEWIQDWYGSYPTSAVTDPTGASSGSSRVLRGGSWSSIAGYCRSALRSSSHPDIRYSSYGFRLIFHHVQ